MARKVDEQKNSDIRRKIVDVSIEIILNKGFSKFTLAEVAKKLNVTKATIYWYFSSKDDLIENISNKIWSLEVGAIQSYENVKSSAKEKLMNLLFQKDNGYSCILPIKFLLEYYNESNEIKTKIQEGYKKYQASLATILSEGKQNGEFHYTVSDSDLAWFILSALDGLSINRFTLEQDSGAISKNDVLTILESILKC